jgi:hypothetical protein
MRKITKARPPVRRPALPGTAKEHHPSALADDARNEACYESNGKNGQAGAASIRPYKCKTGGNGIRLHHETGSPGSGSYYNCAGEEIMGRLRLALTLFVLILLGASASAMGQAGAAHPDLSGTWILNVAKSKFPKQVSPGAQTIYIDCMGSTILMNVSGNSNGHWDKFITDGAEHVIAETSGKVVESGGDSLVHVAYWDKSSLMTKSVLLDVTDAGVGFPMSTKTERWTLSKDGARLSREQDDLIHLVYDKTFAPEAPISKPRPVTE